MSRHFVWRVRERRSEAESLNRYRKRVLRRARQGGAVIRIFPSRLAPLFMGCLVVLIGAGGAQQAMGQTSSLISPTFSVQPATFPAGKQSSAILTVFNGNPLSTAQVGTGDSFTFNVNSSLIGTLTLSGPLTVNSASLSA